MADAGIASDELLVDMRFESHDYYEPAYRRSIELLKRQSAPTAIFIHQIGLASGVLQAASDMKLKLARDLSLATFVHGNPTVANLYLPPRIGGFLGPSEQIGTLAAQRILELIDSQQKLSSNPTITELEGTWFDGDTIGPPVT